MIEGFDWLGDLLLIGGLTVAWLCVFPLLDHWVAWKNERKGKDGQR